MKRNRNRNRNGGGGGGGGGGKPQNNANRAFDSNGPDGVKVRGAAQHIYEKYQQLARDAHTAGDRVLAENHLQHAEHYFRTLRAMQPQRSIADIIGRDQFASGYDIDFEDESGEAAALEPEGEEAEGERAEGERSQHQDWRSDNGDRQVRRDDRFRDDRPRRDDRQRFERGDRSDRPEQRSERVERPERTDRFERTERFERPDRQDRYERQDQRPFDRQDRFERVDKPSVAEPQTGPMLRADDGEMSHAPAFLQSRAPEPRPMEAESQTAAEAPKARRRRAPRATAPAEET